MRNAFNLLLVVRVHNVAAAVLSVGVGYSLARAGAWPWILCAAVALAAALGAAVSEATLEETRSLRAAIRPPAMTWPLMSWVAAAKLVMGSLTRRATGRSIEQAAAAMAL